MEAISPAKSTKSRQISKTKDFSKALEVKYNSSLELTPHEEIPLSTEIKQGQTFYSTHFLAFLKENHTESYKILRENCRKLTESKSSFESLKISKISFHVQNEGYPKPTIANLIHYNDPSTNLIRLLNDVFKVEVDNLNGLREIETINLAYFIVFSLGFNVLNSAYRTFVGSKKMKEASNQGKNHLILKNPINTLYRTKIEGTRELEQT